MAQAMFCYMVDMFNQAHQPTNQLTRPTNKLINTPTNHLQAQGYF
jgi:hypothetical protein